MPKYTTDYLNMEAYSEDSIIKSDQEGPKIEADCEDKILSRKLVKSFL